MSIRNVGRIVWIASLFASVALVGMPAFAQDGGEKRFKLSAPEPEQPAPAPATSAQPAAVKETGELPAPGQTSPEPTAPSEPVVPAQPIPAQPSGTAGGSEASAAAQDQPLAEEPAAAAAPVPLPEDDLPPPMKVEKGAGQPSATAQGAHNVLARQPVGKPLEIVPIREGKLSNLATEGDQKAKSAKSAKSAKVGKSGQSARTVRPSAARPFWLDSRRHPADLSFKQGQVAFILGADVGRRGAYKTFLLDNPPRRVVDIPGRWRYDGPTDHRVRFNGVGSIRVGEHPGFLRIVFDYVQGEARPPLVHTTPDGISVIYFWGE